MTDETKVVRLAEASNDPQPDSLAVERAKELLESVESGRVQGFIIVGEQHDGYLFEGGSNLRDLPLMITGLELAKTRILDVIQNGGTE